MFNSPQIKELIAKNNLCINKRFGQNFLIDQGKRDKMISLCNLKGGDRVLEIGPGLGALTESILSKCASLIAVEKDRGLADILKSLYADNKKLEIVSRDILKYAIPALPDRVKVIGNLPYYITSPIIFYLLENRDRLDSIFITVQKDVAKRILSGPGNKDYGLLSLGVQYYCQPLKLCTLPKGCFFPVPKVDSMFISLEIRKVPLVSVTDERLFFMVMKAGFNQRRKTFFNALAKGVIASINKGLLEEAFVISGLDKNIRAEDLSLDKFAQFSNALSSLHE